MFKKILFIILAVVFLSEAGLLLAFKYFGFKPQQLLSPVVSTSKVIKKTYAPYSFTNLSKRQFSGSQIEIGKMIKKENNSQAYFFYYQSEGKRVSGQVSLPMFGKDLPMLVMLRGYADKEIYFTGLGTRKAAAFFAQKGFVVLAPDFLGFGQSDQESDDILLNRFKRPETVLNLLASLSTLNQTLPEAGLAVTVDPEKVFLWGHSNGGQIALSILEISGQEIPTTLWAPVSQAFPESVLQYADELDDMGKMVIAAVDYFKKDCDPAEYSIANYFDQIRAPLQVHQGTADPYVDLEDTKALVGTLNKLGKNVTYYTYKGDDHNLEKNWDQVVERDLEFFRLNTDYMITEKEEKDEESN